MLMLTYPVYITKGVQPKTFRYILPQSFVMEMNFTIYVLFTPQDTSTVTDHDDFLFELQSVAGLCGGGQDTFRCVSTAKGTVKDAVQKPIQFDNTSLSLSPNPLHSGEPLTIHLDNMPSGKYELRISDLLGNILVSESIGVSGGKQDITPDVSRLAAGAYVVEMGKIYRAKFVKE